MRLRSKTHTKVNELVRNNGIHITSHDFPSHRGLDNIIFKPYENIMSFFTNRISSDKNCLLHDAGLFSTAAEPRPNWNGFMQNVTKRIHLSRSNIVMLTVINLNSNDETCKYSTLFFVIEQLKKIIVMTLSITFNQPLWLEPLEIITATKLDNAPLIGGFHMLMSFFGSIGTIMTGSGINNLSQNIYGANSVKHMLSGRIAPASSAHILTESALLIKLQQKTLCKSEDSTNNVNLEVIPLVVKNCFEQRDEC